ncbi:hypothetical protein P175DRAFT_0558430 [Aspergillus ochraceoroseus IBT 24754]|uniref:DRBM domain-containing protein n=1 Tax=Aspergillus ochraceoroseus IBT 24754 TaxID=1392256 RepID=A0A2T5LVD1_9EURO|nr:uncharacterized protein P175DRAFT_0558430 [Aspergillus ochraceoroseus IBT 24754]PTU20241.1 hypothetical protein P175DRAFT_0558430 [Aspergillus ochraceoroseus IBT 24754]
MSDQSVIKYDWRLKLDNYCWKANIESPTYNTFSDRRGGRTAWSCTVTVTGRGTYAARYWYDGRFVDNAKEDAAEVALKILDPQGQSGQTSSQEPFQGYIERR